MHESHQSGTLEAASRVLAAHPAIVKSIHVAAILGNEAGVRRALDAEPSLATAKGGPRGWDALTHLCFSRYLRLDHSRADSFLVAARALLDAGADPNTGWFEQGHQPSPTWESAIYGAAGVAHHAGLTRLLLERGADPNDDETPYHAPETNNNSAVRVLLESGKLTADSLAMMLVRKADWHDLDGTRLLLEHGADPNRMTRWGWTAFQHAIRRDNRTEQIDLMLDHRADAAIPSRHDGRSALVLAAQRGRADVLGSLRRRGVEIEAAGTAAGAATGTLAGIDALLAACAENDPARIGSLVSSQPGLAAELLARGGTVLAEFAGNGNAAGVARLLDLGIPVDSLYLHGDGYFGIAPMSTALHVAAWRARPAAVKVLIAHGSPVDARDGWGRTALMLAIKAGTDSYWVQRRTPESVADLLAAGASREGVGRPSGWAEVDGMLARRS